MQVVEQRKGLSAIFAMTKQNRAGSGKVSNGARKEKRQWGRENRDELPLKGNQGNGLIRRRAMTK